MPLTQTPSQLLCSTFLNLHVSGCLLTRLRLYLSGRSVLEEMLGSFLPNWVAWLWSVGEAYLDHLIKVEWPKLLPFQVTLFLLVFNKYFMGVYFEAV